MKSVFSLVLGTALVLALSTASAAGVDPRYYEIKKMPVRELSQHEVQQLEQMGLMKSGMSPDCNMTNFRKKTNPPAPVPPKSGPFDGVEGAIDQIINIGKKIWNVIAAGKPVVNVKVDVATALPRGSKCWLDLQGWQMPESKVYEQVFENGFGAEIVNFKYRVLYVAGGSVNGQGAYIGYATMVPVLIDVSWGFSFNAVASVPVVFNMGTKEAPLAGMQMLMQYRVESVMSTIEESQAFVVNGRGEFKQMD